MTDQIPPWGRAHRRIERQAARDLAKDRKSSNAERELAPKDDKVIDKALWFVAGAMTIALFLLAPKLDADPKGKILSVVMLLVMFGCMIHPIWNIPWLRNATHRLVGLLFVAIGISGFGVYIWPRALILFPSYVNFGGVTPIFANNQRYPFRIVNKSDEDVYAVEVDFTIEDKTAFGPDFAVDISKDSRKPFGEGGSGAEHFVDTYGFFCRTQSGYPVYILSIHKLAPQESRELTITHSGTKKIRVDGTVGFFATEPSAVNIDGTVVGSMFEFKVPVDKSACRPFGFLVDENEHPGMYWFNSAGGRY